MIKFSEGADEHKYNIPNYAVFDDAGNCYVTESGAFREISGKILKYDTQGNGSVWHNGPFNFANGLALNHTQDYIFVVSSWLPGVEKVAIGPMAVRAKDPFIALYRKLSPMELPSILKAICSYPATRPTGYLKLHQIKLRLF